MDFQLIIPCYNEAKSLESMIGRTIEMARNHGYAPGQFQLVVVNNGSKDDTPAILQALSEGPMGPWFKIVHVMQNKGYGDGVWQGLQASTAPYIGWTHADEQCDPGDAFIALEKLRRRPHEHVIVKGRRCNRNIGDYVWSRLFELIVLALLGKQLFEVNAQPKIFRRDLLKELPDPPPDFAFDLYVLWRAKRAGWQIVSFPVIFAPRAHGQSNWAFGWRSRLRTGFKMFRYIWWLGQSNP